MLDLESARQIAGALRVCATPGGDCSGCCHEHTPGPCFDRLKKEAAETVEMMAAEAARLREENRWIPVTERLPEVDCCVLVVASGDFGNIHLDRAVEIAEYSVYEGWILEMWPEWENPTVTHWQPLPREPEAV